MNFKTPWLLCFALTLACTGDDSGASGGSSSGSDSGSTSSTPTSGPDDGGSDTPDDGGSDTPDDGGDTMIDTGGDDMVDTGGDTMVDTGDTGDGGSSSGSGGTGATVSGEIDRSTMPGIGQDAIGDIYLGLLVSCDQSAGSVASTVVMDADLSMNGSSVTYEITDVPDGTYYLAGFMDDNDDADPMNPDADMGDLASAMGFSPACTEVTITGGADVSGIDLTLNLVVPI